MKIYIKIITGYRPDEYISIPSSEAHRAYYLFNHPNERGVFSNGRPCIGSRILDIKPDYHATMGWNPEHKIDTYDMNRVISSGAYEKCEHVLRIAKEVAEKGGQKMIHIPLKEAYSQVTGNDPTKLESTTTTKRTEELRTLKATKLSHITNNLQRV